MKQFYRNLNHFIFGCEWIEIDVDKAYRFMRYHHLKCSHCGAEKTELEIVKEELPELKDPFTGL